jgi:phosphoribosylamine--glycine ligase
LFNFQKSIGANSLSLQAMNVLIIGNGGREHAFAYKIKQSSLCKNVYIAPGNAGTAQEGINLNIATDNFDALAQACIEKKIDLIIVGPELPLVKGIRDYFEQHTQVKHIPMVGPGKVGAQLEGSKDFSKQFMLRHHVPTAQAKTFTKENLAEGLRYLETCNMPIVLKADGLAAGKGVIIAQSLTEAKQELTEMLADGKFGAASASVLIEEFLQGIELSVFVLTDGEDYIILPEAKDYKRIGDGDTGLNTGGMGSVSPVVFADTAFLQKVESEVILPTIQGLKKEGISYKGFIFIGLMNVKGKPYVIEYNARMGDPETQSVLSRIDSDLLELLQAAATGKLKQVQFVATSDYTVSVVMASGGYPGDFKKGFDIKGLSTAQTKVFHAGTKNVNQSIVTDGGRVLAVTGRGKTLAEAREKAYETVGKINWEGVTFRKDIGLDLMSWKNG